MVGLILIIGMLGFLGVRRESHETLDRALSRFQASLPPQTQLIYRRAEPLILHHGARLEDVIFRHNGLEVKAKSLVLRAVRGTFYSGIQLGHAAATGLMISGSGGVMTAQSLRIAALHIPPITKTRERVLARARRLTPARNALLNDFSTSGLASLAALRFDRMTAHDLHFHDASSRCKGQSDRLTVGHYGIDRGSDLSMDKATVTCTTPPIGDSLPFMQIGQQPLTITVANTSASGVDLAGYLIDGRLDEAGPDDDETPVATHADTGRIMVRDFRAESGPLTVLLPQLRTDLVRHGDISHIRTTIDGPRVLNHGAPLSAVFERGGKARITSTTIVQHDKGTARSTETVTVPDLADMALDTEVDHLPGTQDAAPAKSDGADAPMGRLVSFTATYHDHSLLSRLTDHYVALHQQSADDVRQQLAMLVTLAVAPVPGLSDLPGYLAQPGGRSFTLAFHPGTPVSIAGIEATGLRNWADAHPAMLAPPVLTGVIN